MAKLQARVEYHTLSSRRVTIGDDTRCDVCNRVIGEAPFALYPNSTLAHKRCIKDIHECPVTGKRFDV